MARTNGYIGKTEAAAERRLRVLDLRIGGHSFRDIARTTGISQTQVRRDVDFSMKGMARIEEGRADELRQLECARLEKARVQASEVLESAAEDSIKLHAIATLVKISESLRRLLGLDRQPLTDGGSGASIQIVYSPLTEAHGESNGAVIVADSPALPPKPDTTDENQNPAN